MNNNRIECNLSIDATSLVQMSFRASLFGYSVKVVLNLKDWKIHRKVKSWFVFAHVGPVYFKVVDENKLTDYINKVLQDNEDKLHSEM
jgi:hypothetical protein